MNNSPGYKLWEALVGVASKIWKKINQRKETAPRVRRKKRVERRIKRESGKKKYEKYTTIEIDETPVLVTYQEKKNE